MELHSSDETHSESTPAAAVDDVAPATSRYLLRALLAGMIAGAPVAWILAYLAPMPYFLGLFFFLLLGLLVGAVMCRAARAGAPIPRSRSTPVSLVVTFLVWSGVLATEYRWFPDLAADQAWTDSLKGSMSRRDIQNYRDRVKRAVREELEARYWPGAFPGYLRWSITSGRMNVPRAGRDLPVPIQNVQLPVGWILRVLASLALLMFAIDSQMASLAPKRVLEEEDAEQTGNENKA